MTLSASRFMSMDWRRLPRMPVTTTSSIMGVVVRVFGERDLYARKGAGEGDREHCHGPYQAVPGIHGCSSLSLGAY